jgi:hypothetical protein
MIFLRLLAGHLLLLLYDPGHLTQKRVLIIDCMIAAGWYGDAIAGSGYEPIRKEDQILWTIAVIPENGH